MPIPYPTLDTIFLDVGNTLMSVDFHWVQTLLAEHDIDCDVLTLRRAEAAARPTLSRRLEQLASTEGDASFRFYLECVLTGVPAVADDEVRRTALVDALLPVLRAPGVNRRLWSYVLPGVPEALARLRHRGLRLVAVSNSDGTVEASLVDQGLRAALDDVIDSHVVGFQKPDPRIFHHALERSGAEPSRTVHVGDLFHADIVGARAAGIHALLVDPYDDWPDADCPRIPDLPALAEAVEGS